MAWPLAPAPGSVPAHPGPCRINPSHNRPMEGSFQPCSLFVPLFTWPRPETQCHSVSSRLPVCLLFVSSSFLTLLFHSRPEVLPFREQSLLHTLVESGISLSTSYIPSLASARPGCPLLYFTPTLSRRDSLWGYRDQDDHLHCRAISSTFIFTEIRYCVHLEHSVRQADCDHLDQCRYQNTSRGHRHNWRGSTVPTTRS